MRDDPITQTKQLGIALKAARKSHSLRQTDLAVRSGLLPKTISLLENNPAACSVDTLFRALSSLNLEISIKPRGKNSVEEAW